MSRSKKPTVSALSLVVGGVAGWVVGGWLCSQANNINTLQGNSSSPMCGGGFPWLQAITAFAGVYVATEVGP